MIRRNEHRIENDPSGEENDDVSSSSQAPGRRKTYKRVEELTPEGRALHDELPDLGYMLSDRLIFPAVGGEGNSKG